MRVLFVLRLYKNFIFYEFDKSKLVENAMKNVLYFSVQCTWGILQSLLGLINFLLHIRDRHYFYHGAVITEWNDKSSVSLGMFVYVTKEP